MRGLVKATCLFGLGAGLLVSLAACSTAPIRTVSPPPSVPQASAPPPPAAPPAPSTESPGRPAPPPQVEVITPPQPLVQIPPQPPTAPAGRATAPGGGRLVVLNFDNADIEAVIHAASEVAGFNYTLAPDVRGKVTIQTSTRIPQEEVFNVLLAILEVHGLTAVKSGNLYKIIRIAAAKEKPIPTIIGAEPDPNRSDDEVITQIIPLAHASAAEISAVIRPLVGKDGNLAVHRDGNLLLLTDTAGNIRRLLQIIKVMDVEVATDELRIFQIRFADATDLAAILNQFFAGTRTRPGPARPAAPPPAPPPPAPGRPAPRAAPPPTAPAPPAEPEQRQPLILADKRTNSLIVLARHPDLDMIQRLVAKLDVDTKANKRVIVYYVENVKAKELAVTLQSIFGKEAPSPERPAAAALPFGAPPPPPVPPAPYGAPPPPAPLAPPRPSAPGRTELTEAGVVEGEVKIVADEPTNALIITTFPRNWPLIEETIRKLDRVPKQVLIEVLVAEISLDDSTSLGIEWSVRTQSPIKIGGEVFSIGSVTRLDVGAPGIAPTPPGLSFFLFETDRILGLLQAFEKINRLNVVSSPHVLTSENKKAYINVGRSIPLVTSQQQPTIGVVAVAPNQQAQSFTTQTVEYRDTGVILTVTPRISEKRLVALDVKQEVSDAIPNTLGGTQSPIITKRVAETSVVVADNQTLVLGGLLETRRTRDREGIPFLSRIPVLGYLFGQTTDVVKKTELLILITPRVVGDPAEAQALYQDLRRRSRELDKAVQQAPAITAPTPPPPPAPEGPTPSPPAPDPNGDGGWR